jgi:hypothetical protein
MPKVTSQIALLTSAFDAVKKMYNCGSKSSSRERCFDSQPSYMIPSYIDAQQITEAVVESVGKTWTAIQIIPVNHIVAVPATVGSVGVLTASGVNRLKVNYKTRRETHHRDMAIMSVPHSVPSP